jgi:subtilisin family serine protease
MPIPGEYIVNSLPKSKMATVKRQLGKNLFLIKTSANISLKNTEELVPNYRYFGEYREGLIETKRGEDNKNKAHHHNMIETLKAWDITKGSSEIIVAVTDNEFQINHENLKDSWWTNPKEIADNGIDDDGNGYIDDVYGWDFAEKDNNVDTTDEGTHGTHVAGTIAARTKGLEGSGIAPNVKIMPLRWYDFDIRFTSAVVAETYHYAVDHGAKIISTSYNVDWLASDAAYREAVKYATDNEVLIINSAGNADELNPRRQSIKEIVLVCSVKSGDKLDQDIKSKFSNYGNGVDICGPGDPIYSTVQSYSGTQNAFRFMKGTSMAAPTVAATAALIWSVNPNFTVADVKKRLFTTADNIDVKNEKYQGLLGAGRLNTFNAVK